MIYLDFNIKVVNFIQRQLIKYNLAREKTTIMVTGSLSIEMLKQKPMFDKFFNGQSDIDIFLILNIQDMNIINNKFSQEQIIEFYNNKLNVLNYSYQYGRGRNSFNIKYIKEKTFINLFSFEEINFISLRKNSLVDKKSTLKAQSLTDYIIIDYCEFKKENFYYLEYKFKPYQKNKYYLSDIHSMLYFGCIFGVNSFIFKEHINVFNQKIGDIIDTNNHEDILNLFKYFITKKSLSKDNLYIIIRKFNKNNKE